MSTIAKSANLSSSAPAPKRARKRRRRQASYSASSSSDSSSEDEAAKPAVGPDINMAGSSSSSSSSSLSSSSSSSYSSSSSSSSSESDSDPDSDSTSAPRLKKPTSTTVPGALAASVRPTPKVRPTRHISNSPSPPPVSVPSFLSARGRDPVDEEEDDRRARFRRVYMEKLVEGFGSDLDKLRTADPTMNPARIQLLVNSLQAGMDIFSDPMTESAVSENPTDSKVDEVAIILGKDA